MGSSESDAWRRKLSSSICLRDVPPIAERDVRRCAVIIKRFGQCFIHHAMKNKKKIKLTALSEQKMKIIKGGQQSAMAACYCGSICHACDSISVRGYSPAGMINAAGGLQQQLE